MDYNVMGINAESNKALIVVRSSDFWTLMKLLLCCFICYLVTLLKFSSVHPICCNWRF